MHRLSCFVAALALGAGCAGRGHTVKGVEIVEGSARRSLDPDALARRSAGAVGVVTTDIGRGMAFVIDPRGYLISNRHVIEDADHIEDIVFPALDPPLRFVGVEVVYIDPRQDLALLRVDTRRPLPWLPLATDRDRPPTAYLADADRVLVLARRPPSRGLGDAAGLVAHVGHIDELAVENPAVGPGPYLGLSPDVRRGQSGGPVIDRFGRAVGVVTWMWKDRPGGFAIPIGHAARMLAERPVLASLADHETRAAERAAEFLAAIRGDEFEVARRITSPSHARRVRQQTVDLLLDQVPRELVAAYVDALEELLQTARARNEDPFADLRAVIGATGGNDLRELVGARLSRTQVMAFFYEFGQAYLAARTFGELDGEASAQAAVERLHSLDAARSFALAESLERLARPGLAVERVDVLSGAYAPRALVRLRDAPGASIAGAERDGVVLQMRWEWGDWYVADVQTLRSPPG
jgi:hypothetical protein